MCTFLFALLISLLSISAFAQKNEAKVMCSLVDVSIDNLARGTIVRLGGLSFLPVSLSSDSWDTAPDASASSIKNTKVIFTPRTRIKEMQQVALYPLLYSRSSCEAKVYLE